MAHLYALSMTRPHETLGLPQPFGRRLPQGMTAWNMTISVATILSIAAYIVIVNTSAAKGYSLRKAEQNVEALKTETTILQNTMVTLSSMRQLSDSASAMGLIPTDRVEYVTPAAASYALAK